MAKGTLQMQLSYAILKWGDYSGLSSGPNVITKVLTREKKVGETQRKIGRSYTVGFKDEATECR